jgi:pyruvate/2-oxoglutarate dehydrogenase complex dihydrolipoamide acyltransferase (E2) component
MLVFQTASLLLNFCPPVIELLAMAWRWAWHKFFPAPADRFAAVVRAVMSQNQSILGRKYADRWLLRVHGRGLNERALCHHEKAQQLLPFDLRALRPTLTRMRAFGGGNRRQAATDAAQEAVAATAAAAQAQGQGRPGLLASMSGRLRASKARRELRRAASTAASLQPDADAAAAAATDASQAAQQHPPGAASPPSSSC